MACPCGYEGDLLKHWASVPTCMPAYAQDREADIRAAPPAAPHVERAPRAASDVDGARALVHSQTVKRLGKLVLKDKVRLKTTQEFKELMNEHNEFAANVQALESLHTDPQALQASFNAFDGLETEKQVLAELEASIPHVKPTMRKLGTYSMKTTDDDGREYLVADKVAECADTDIYESIALMMNSNPKACEWMLDFNQRWAAGTAGVPEPERYTDFTEGSNFLNDPRFRNGIPDGVLLVPIAIEADEAENCNAVATCAGKHKIFNFIVKVLSLPKDVRNDPKYTVPACHVLDDHMTVFGDLKVIGGVDAAYVPLPGHETSIGAQLREDGRSVVVGSKLWLMKLAFFDLRGDYLGLGKLGVTSVSAGSVDNGTFKGCRQCEYDRRHPDRAAPQRELEELLKQCDECATCTTKASRTRLFQRTGVRRATFCFHPKVTPGFDITKSAGEDGMHLEGGGTIPPEAKEMIRRHIQEEKLYTFVQLESALRRLKQQYPVCRTIPNFHPRILKKKTKGLRIKAADAHIFMRYSIKLFTMLLDKDSADPSWRAWKVHHKYFNLMFQESLSRQEVDKLGALIKKHHKLLGMIKGYRKIPKNHFATHVPQDTRRAGPARYRWCFSLEGYNKRVNEWARHSKYKNVLLHVAKYNNLQTGYELLYDD